MATGKLPLHRRLGVQMGAAMALVAGLAFAATGWALVQHERETLTREVTLRVLAEAQSLALASSGPLLRHDPELELHPLVMKAVREHRDLVEVVVLDREGIVQGHAELRHIGQPMSIAPGNPLPFVPPADGRLAWIEGDHIVVSQPIRHLEHEVGILVTRASQASIQDAVRASMRSILLISGAGLLLLLALALTLVARHLRPLGALRAAVAGIGRGDFSTRVQVGGSNELALLGGLINEMAEGLEEAQAQRLERERLDHELEIARELQYTLLPATIAAPEGWSVAAHYTPALEVSGDYYDVMPLEDGSIAVIAADVSGKGVPGLVVMAMLRTIVRGVSAPGRSPVEILTRANRALEGAMGRGMFITCLYGILDPVGGGFEYASAGHCKPLLVHSGGELEWLDAGGKAVGMFGSRLFDASLKPRRVSLLPGDCLLLYTDGLPEAMDGDHNQLGLDPVEEVARAAAEQGAGSLVKRLLELVDGHRAGAHANDDLTLLALRHDGSRTGGDRPSGVATEVVAP